MATSRVKSEPDVEAAEPIPDPDSVGPPELARLLKTQVLRLLPKSGSGNDALNLLKMIQLIPGWREGFVAQKPRQDPDSDVDGMSLEEVTAEFARLTQIAGQLSAEQKAEG